ncbi:MarC family protein [Sphingomonas sp.]|uniref:MarC family protein n=1 Tax=Sphingomonas sp. TaxID=28214 RepID=UPI00286CBD88|nr:MarC family protein [Sphingomonas sp.]
MTELFTTAFITLLVIIDPPGCAPIFASLTAGTDSRHRRAMAVRSVVVAWFILMFFALLGEPLLRTLGISLSAFRLAGGIMLFMIALDMVFERRTERREERAEGLKGTPDADDISVFPMAIPMIAGPGSIATIMLMSARAEGTVEGLIVFGAMTAVLALTLLALLAAGPLMKFVGPKLEAMITRILGVILAALAAQFVLDGLERSLPGLAG